MKQRLGNVTYWYWGAFWYDRHEKREYYSEAHFGADRARELAFEARRVEKEFRRRIMVKGQSSLERKAIRIEQRAARLARAEMIKAQTREGATLIRGVDYDPIGDRYIARYYWGKRRCRSFSVKKYGDEKARQMAVECRKKADARKLKLRFDPDSADEISAFEASR